MGMRLEIDMPEHHYHNIMAFDSVNLGRVPYKGIIMYAINAIKHGRVLDQEPATKNDLGVDCIVDVLGSYTDLDIPYKREIAENILTKLSSVTPQEPTDKNFTKADIDAIVKAINAGWELRVNEILDKIRAEIIEDCGYSKDYVGAFTYSTIKLKTVLQIIDKYKAEVEPQESEEV